MRISLSQSERMLVDKNESIRAIWVVAMWMNQRMDWGVWR